VLLRMTLAKFRRKFPLPKVSYVYTSTQQMNVIFLPRDAMRKRGLCSRPVSVRRSVRACVRLTLACCIHTAEDIVKLLSLSDSPIILVFGPGADTQFQGEPPSSGVQNTQGRENVRFSTEIAIYLGNGMR